MTDIVRMIQPHCKPNNQSNVSRHTHLVNTILLGGDKKYYCIIVVVLKVAV